MKFNLQEPYITKKIDVSALKTVLASTYQTAYRLYLITNNVKEVQPFYENENKDYHVIASIKTSAAAAGEARAQIWNVKHLQPILRIKPRYILRCRVTNKQTNKVIYRSEIISIKADTIYSEVLLCIKDLDKILNN